LEEVSTTRGSGWVRSHPATDVIIATHPPAIAGGTDCIQQRKQKPDQERRFDATE